MISRVLLSMLAFPVFFSCAAMAAIDQSTVQGATLRAAAGDRLLIGAALGPKDLSHPQKAELIATQFSCLTTGNDMKPDALQKVQGAFTFEQADRFVEFAQAHEMRVIGHTLLWHSQAPKWLFEGPDGKPLPREKALQNLRSHIHGVVGHFKGKIHGWDVVNEAIADGPDQYLRETPALRAIGEDYIIKAFEYAHEADPDVELYYNDYNIEADYKRPKAIRLINELKAAGVKIAGVGVQGHWQLEHPSAAEIDRGLTEIIALGLPVMITELDVDPLPRKRGGGADVTATEREGQDPYKAGFPAEMQQKMADRYRELFKLFVRHPEITRVTFWGVDDASSWLNDFPVRGRTNYPMLWDRALNPKPAFDAVLETLRAPRD